MIRKNISVCPKCGGELRYYDSVRRIVRTKARITKWVNIRRLRCSVCGSIHRELPEELFPYKQYEAEVIIGVVDGLITCETLGLVLLDGAAGLVDFYDELDEEHTPIMNKVRWHCDSRIPTMDIEFGAEISEHGLPYLTFTYECDEM